MDTTTEREIGRRIQQLRKDQALTQEAFGEALGLDQPTVSKIESGNRTLTVRELAIASGVLGVTVDQLLSVEQEATPVLLRADSATDEKARAAIRIFNECIDDYRGLQALAGE